MDQFFYLSIHQYPKFAGMLYMICHVNMFKMWNLFLGTCRNCNQTKLQEEAQFYNNIVVFDFLDTYVNLTIKTIVSLNWVFNSYNTDIFLKLDDDALLSVTNVHQTLFKILVQ